MLYLFTCSSSCQKCCFCCLMTRVSLWYIVAWQDYSPGHMNETHTHVHWVSLEQDSSTQHGEQIRALCQSPNFRKVSTFEAILVQILHQFRSMQKQKLILRPQGFPKLFLQFCFTPQVSTWNTWNVPAQSNLKGSMWLLNYIMRRSSQ